MKDTRFFIKFNGNLIVDHPPRLLDRMRAVLRTKHYSYLTEKAYVFRVRRYILFHGKRHPDPNACREWNWPFVFPTILDRLPRSSRYGWWSQAQWFRPRGIHSPPSAASAHR